LVFNVLVIFPSDGFLIRAVPNVAASGNADAYRQETLLALQIYPNGNTSPHKVKVAYRPLCQQLASELVRASRYRDGILISSAHDIARQSARWRTLLHQKCLQARGEPIGFHSG
jgi:hypothetical protein